jgi:transcriptional regulator with XRE-family HTH domain
MTTDFGSTLRAWRRRRHLSQLDLAVEADVSQRHLSFLETGKSKPSREMVVHLASTLDVPLRERNRLLVAAGFAPRYPERGLDEPAMDQVRHVLELLLAAHQPFPAFVVDRRWDLVMANGVATALTGLVAGDAGLGDNLMRLSLHPDGIRPMVANWEAAATVLVHRLEREVADRPTDQGLADLLAEVSGYPGVAELPDRPSLPDGSELLVPLDLRTPLGDLSFFTTITTIGAPFDVTLEELRLETLLPADAATEATLRSLVG